MNLLARLKAAARVVWRGTVSEATAEEIFGTPVPLEEYLFANGRPLSPVARVYGPETRPEKNATLRTLQDHDLARNRSRVLAETNPNAIGLLQRVQAYVVGRGSSSEVQSAVEGQDPPKRLSKRVTDFIKKFKRANAWLAREKEIQWRLHVDGEFFLRFFPHPDGTTRVRFVECANVRPPLGEDAEGPWSFGVYTPEGDAEEPTHFCIHNFVTNADEIVEAHFIIHGKVNCLSNQKRGVPSLYACEGDLVGAAKLRHATREGEKNRASINYFRRHKAASEGTMRAFRESQARAVGLMTDASAPDNASQVYVEVIQPGSTIDIPEGLDPLPPPGSPNVQGSATSVEQAMEAVAARFGVPVWVVSGKTDQGNFAQSLVVESPFTVTVEDAQSALAEWSDQAQTKAIEIAVEQGLLPEGVLDVIDLMVSFPSPVSRNQGEQTQRFKTLRDNNIVSERTWSVEEGFDPDKERQQIVEERKDQIGYIPSTIREVIRPGATQAATPNAGTPAGDKAAAGNGAAPSSTPAARYAQLAGRLREQAGEFDTLAEAESFFGECDRDEHGYCLPGGGGGAKGGGDRIGHRSRVAIPGVGREVEAAFRADGSTHVVTDGALKVVTWTRDGTREGYVEDAAGGNVRGFVIRDRQGGAGQWEQEPLPQAENERLRAEARARDKTDALSRSEKRGTFEKNVGHKILSPAILARDLSRAGIPIHKRTARETQSGVKVREVPGKKTWLSVEWIQHGGPDFDFQAKSEELQKHLESQGYLVSRPFPDQTLLAVRSPSVSLREQAEEFERLAEAEFNEEDHPRDDDGKFGEGGGGTAEKAPSGGGDRARKTPAARKGKTAAKAKAPAARAFGEAGGAHPLAGLSREEQVKKLAAINGRAMDGDPDPLGLEKAGPPDVMKDPEFADDLVGAVSRFADRVGSGASMADAYEAIGGKYGLSKWDFMRAMNAAHEEGLVRLSGWPKTIDDLPDPALATFVSRKLMYRVNPATTAVGAGSERGDLSLTIRTAREREESPLREQAGHLDARVGEFFHKGKLSVGGRDKFFKTAPPSAVARSALAARLAAQVGVAAPEVTHAELPGGKSGILTDWVEGKPASIGQTFHTDQEGFRHLTSEGAAKLKASLKPGELDRAALFAVLTGQADRDLGNYLVNDGRLVQIDNDETFWADEGGAPGAGEFDRLAADNHPLQAVTLTGGTFDPGVVREFAAKAPAMASAAGAENPEAARGMLRQGAALAAMVREGAFGVDDLRRALAAQTGAK